MGAYRDENKNGTWYCKFSYVNWKGQKLNKKKRGFLTKKETLTWEKEFLNGQAGSVELTFREFFELYKRDKTRIRENTWRTKEAIVNSKIMPCWWMILLMWQLFSGKMNWWKSKMIEVEIILRLIFAQYMHYS